jgi:myo-inositol-1(or 4)-monophosphatase
MHDPTEGGIRAGLHEIAFASRVRLDVDLDRVPAQPPTAGICRHYGIDQRGGLATTRRALAVDNSVFSLSKPLASRLPRSGSMIIDGNGCVSGDDRLRLAVALAHQGGRQAVAARGTARVGWKAPGDRVTDVDVAIQVRLVDRIRTCFPGDGIVAEEGAAADPGEREFVWAIDPLDGTNNFALGIPCFAVSIGILRHGLPHAGVVHDPNTGFTTWAARGQGAVAGGQTIVLGEQPLTEASNVAVRVPLDPDLAAAVTGWLRRYKLRGFGSVALHLAYAAIGALDVVQDHKATLWDVAAGAAILLEAGGRITDPRGRPLFPPAASAYRGAPMPLLAGNPTAHAQALADCRPVPDAAPAEAP